LCVCVLWFVCLCVCVWCVCVCGVCVWCVCVCVLLFTQALLCSTRPLLSIRVTSF